MKPWSGFEREEYYMGNWKAPIGYLVSPFDRVVSGQIVVSSAGSAVQLGVHPLRSGITIKALSTNGDDIYVGGQNVYDANGFILAAGEQIFVETSNLSNVYIDSAVNGEGVSFIGG